MGQRRRKLYLLAGAGVGVRKSSGLTGAPAVKALVTSMPFAVILHRT